MKWISVIATLSLLNSAFCGNDIDPDFMNWMLTNLGPNETAEMVRDDLVAGSFGGGVLSAPTIYRPVVLVNGLNGEAGMFLDIRNSFVASGIPKQYVFATTWGSGTKILNLMADIKMSCENVKHTRRFIQIVQNYTGAAQVDVIGYSMGSPTSRKAILGGKCVDTDENLGDPLTSIVNTYISVAGANQGAQMCTLPIFPVCNTQTGMNCGSNFLNDINAAEKYESSVKSYNLQSDGDDIVGYHLLCGKIASEFSGAVDHTLSWKNHAYTILNTADIQFDMLRNFI